MARPLRLEYPGSLWHVTARGNEKRNIVRDDCDRRMFIELLGKATQRFDWLLDSYALMTNHYHLVIELTRKSLSRGMHWLNAVYARRFNRRHDRVGHLFQSRFGAILIEKESHYREVLRYVVLNPVRAGMVPHPGDYEWTSYRATAGDAPVPEWLAVGRVLSAFGPTRELALEEYRRFVHAGIAGTPRPWDHTVGQIYLGTESWLDSVRLKIKEDPRSDEHPRVQVQARTRALSMNDVIAAVAKTLAVEEETIRKGRGGVPRLAAAWLGRYEADLDLRTIAAALSIRSAGHASRLIARGDRLARESGRTQALLAQCTATLHTVEKREKERPDPVSGGRGGGGGWGRSIRRGGRP